MIAPTTPPRSFLVSPRPRLHNELARDVHDGLTARPKTLPSKHFYDARGSQLFEAICDLPEYYLTRTERSILRQHAHDIVAHLPAGTRLVELGAGSATKTRLLIDALVRREGTVSYTPIDISEEAMRTAQANIAGSFPRTVRFEGLLGEYQDGLARLTRADPQPKLVLFLGSSIGNFTVDEATRFLGSVRDAMGPDDRLLLGLDLAKPADILIAAYDDDAGVTARFNKNLLTRIDRELGADFDLARFRHEARWDAHESRIEMHLVADVAHPVHIGVLGLDVRFCAGESIHTENSYKYTPRMIERLTRDSGFTRVSAWTDPGRLFALHLLTPCDREDHAPGRWTRPRGSPRP